MKTATKWKPADQSFTPQDFEAMAAECGALPNQCVWRTWQEYGPNAAKGYAWQAQYEPPGEPSDQISVFDAML